MSGLMNNYFYGKAGQGDYTVEQMPTTRKQLFFTTLRVRFSSMIGLNFLHVLFVLPLLIWTFIGYQTLDLLLDDQGYTLGGAEMETAYHEYVLYRDEYEAIENLDRAEQELKYELEEAEAQIAKIQNGETVTVTEAAVVEGGEETQRNLTLEEVTSKRDQILADLEKQGELREKSENEAYMEDLRANYSEASRVYNAYKRSLISSNISMTLLIMIPLIGIAGIGSTGQMYVLRNWARDEHAFLWQDYKAAIKANWKQGLVVGLLNGLSIFICYIAYFTYGDMAANNSFFLIPQMLMIVLLLVWWMMNEIIFPMMVTYKMTIRQLLRNSAIMVIARLPLSFVILLGSLLVPAAILFLIPYVQISLLVLILFYGLIGYSLTGFVYASYANSCFDKFLNPRIEGAEVNKGLRKPEEYEEEAAPVAEVEQKEDRFWEHKTK